MQYWLTAKTSSSVISETEVGARSKIFDEYADEFDRSSADRADVGSIDRRRSGGYPLPLFDVDLLRKSNCGKLQRNGTLFFLPLLR